MRVLLVSHGYSEPERFKLPRELAKSHEVTLLAPKRITTVVFGDLSAPPPSDGVAVVANRTVPFGTHFLFRPSWRAFRQFRPDVIQIEYDPWTPEFWSALLPLKLLYPRTPIVLQSKKNTRHIPKGPLGVVERTLTRLGMAKVAVLLAASRKVARMYATLGYGHTPTVVQPHLGLDGDLFRPHVDAASYGPPTDDTIVIGYVGSLSNHKGVATLIRSVEALRHRTNRQVRLALAGPIRDDDLHVQIEERSWISKVDPMTNEEVATFLPTLDVFVMPSLVLPDHEEHDGQALMEAMGAGLPCIGSRSGIIPEIIEDRVSGLLFDPTDEGALTDLLAELLDDAPLRRALSQHARSRALGLASLPMLAGRRVATYRHAIETVARGGRPDVKTQLTLMGPRPVVFSAA
jgi:glycosyltransferase involved in cell wall biosynthesis